VLKTSPTGQHASTWYYVDAVQGCRLISLPLGKYVFIDTWGAVNEACTDNCGILAAMFTSRRMNSIHIITSHDNVPLLSKPMNHHLRLRTAGHAGSISSLARSLFTSAGRISASAARLWEFRAHFAFINCPSVHIYCHSFEKFYHVGDITYIRY
jgi:hypothetical protein